MNTLILPTARPELILRQLGSEQDAQAVLEAIEDNREYLSQLGNSVGRDLVDAPAIEADWAKEAGSLYLGLWHNDELKTVISAHPRGSSEIEVGYWTRYNAQGHGFAGLAVRALTDYLKPHYERVFAEVHVENTASAQVLLDNGYQQIGSIERKWGSAIIFEA